MGLSSAPSTAVDSEDGHGADGDLIDVDALSEGPNSVVLLEEGENDIVWSDSE